MLPAVYVLHVDSRGLGGKLDCTSGALRGIGSQILAFTTQISPAVEGGQSKTSSVRPDLEGTVLASPALSERRRKECVWPLRNMRQLFLSSHSFNITLLYHLICSVLFGVLLTYKLEMFYSY